MPVSSSLNCLVVDDQQTMRSLVRSGLRRLAERGVAGCVVLGDPSYYVRLGFGPSGGLRYPGPPADHFMAYAVAGNLPAGQVRYHAAFDVDP